MDCAPAQLRWNSCAPTPIRRAIGSLNTILFRKLLLAVGARWGDQFAVGMPIAGTRRQNGLYEPARKGLPPITMSVFPPSVARSVDRVLKFGVGNAQQIWGESRAKFQLGGMSNPVAKSPGKKHALYPGDAII